MSKSQPASGGGRDGAPDLVGRVRLVSPQIDRTSQLGKVRRDIARVRTLLREKAVQQ